MDMHVYIQARKILHYMGMCACMFMCVQSYTCVTTCVHICTDACGQRPEDKC